MVQVVYVLELAQPSGHARIHFARPLGAAQRAVRRQRTGGVWQAVADDAKVRARLLDGERELARAVRETVEYFQGGWGRAALSAPCIPSAMWHRHGRSAIC